MTNDSSMDNANVIGFPNATFWPGVFKDSAGNHCFQIGDYVRLVGTLWRDELHAGGGTQGEASLCWQQESTPNIGWTEMHPVDYITKLPPPAANRNNASMDYGIHTLGTYAICSTDFGSYQGISFTTIPAYKPVPFAGAGYENNQAHVTEVVHDPYVNWLSLVYPYNTSSQSSRTGVSTDGKSVSLQVIVQATQDHRGLFSGYYDIYWSCAPSCPSNRCLSDGCGGLTCPNSCTGNFVCTAGTDAYSCQCPSPYAVCATTNACILPSDCPVCPVGVTTDHSTGVLVQKGSSANVQVAATAGGGSQGVSFSAPSPPQNTTVTFTPVSTNVGTASTMTIAASSVATVGTFPMQIVASPTVCPQASTTINVKIVCPSGQKNCGDAVCRPISYVCP